jgi:hypothetical protein
MLQSAHRRQLCRTVAVVAYGWAARQSGPCPPRRIVSGAGQMSRRQRANSVLEGWRRDVRLDSLAAFLPDCPVHWECIWCAARQSCGILAGQSSELGMLNTVCIGVYYTCIVTC